MSSRAGTLDVYRGRRVLVLGAGGFIGRSVASALHERGAELVLAARDTATAKHVLGSGAITAALHAVDLAQPGAAAALVAEVRPSIVFNLAGYGVDRSERDEVLAQRLNSDLVAELADALEADASWPGQVLVHTGSALEFGATSGDLADAWRCSPTTLYGRTKLDGSVRLLEASLRRGLKAICARLFTVYGQGEHSGRLLPSLVEAARGTAAIPLTAATQRRDFTYVEDVAEGLLRLGAVDDEFGPRALNLATGELATVREFTETAARVLGIDRGRLRFGELPTRAEEMAHDAVSLVACEELLGWKPSTPIELGVTRTVAFERRTGAR